MLPRPSVQRAPNVWDRFYHAQQAPWRGARPVAPFLDLPQPMLELGCGNGKTLLPLRQAGIDAIGLDISWNIISRLPEAGILGDIRALPFADESFGTVLDLHCSGHLRNADRLQALSEIRRIIKPGGIVVLERLAEDDLRASQGTASGEMRRLEDGRETIFLSLEALQKEAETAGFAVADVDEDLRHPSHRGTKIRRHMYRLWLQA